MKVAAYLVCLIGAVSAYPHHGDEGRNNHGGCVMKRLKVACEEDADRFCPEEVDSDDVTSVYACMHKHQEEVNSECLEIAQSNTKINARLVCATEIKEGCPDIGTWEEDIEDRRCLHDLYSTGFTEECAEAFEAAWTEVKEVKGLSSDETPMDDDVSEILIQREMESEPYIEDGYFYPRFNPMRITLVTLGICFVGLTLILACACCFHQKRRQRQQRIVNAERYRAMASAPPPTYPVAMPYQQPQQQAIQLPVAVPNTNMQQQQLSRSGYPGLH